MVNSTATDCYIRSQTDQSLVGNKKRFCDLPKHYLPYKATNQFPLLSYDTTGHLSNVGFVKMLVYKLCNPRLCRCRFSHKICLYLDVWLMLSVRRIRARPFSAPSTWTETASFNRWQNRSHSTSCIQSYLYVCQGAHSRR